MCGYRSTASYVWIHILFHSLLSFGFKFKIVRIRRHVEHVLSSSSKKINRNYEDFRPMTTNNELSTSHRNTRQHVFITMMSRYSNNGQNYNSYPIPMMPSPLFQQLALSQLELLAATLTTTSTSNSSSWGRSKSTPTSSCSKIRFMALYLPQENSKTGQLEFTPAIVYPNPNQERIFIANDANSGLAPILPKKLTVLPGFAHATSLLPAYPMLSTTTNHEEQAAGVGVVEEFLCDLRLGGTSLSVPLLSGSQTVGVLLVSPKTTRRKKGNVSSSTDKERQANSDLSSSSFWTIEDRQMVSKVAKSLSLALYMDMERNELQMNTEVVYEALSDSIHQFKNPLQALRTFSKLLQQRIASDDNGSFPSSYKNYPQILELTQHLIVQTDRLVERLKPVDSIVETLGERRRPLAALNPVKSITNDCNDNALVPWRTPFLLTEQQDANVANPTKNIRRRIKSNAEHDTLDVTHNATNAYSIVNDIVDATKGQSRLVPTNRDSDNDKHEKISNVTTAGSSSLSLINDCDLEMVFIMDVLDPILSAFKAIANERGITFTIEGDDVDELPGVTACPEALQEALSNILDNAMKYVILRKQRPSNSISSNDSNSNRNPNPHVRIRLLANHKPIAAGVTILIEDNGPGISKEDRNKVLYERGYRNPRMVEYNIPGRGLGLYLARCMIEDMMGGSISIVDPLFYDKSLNGTIVQIVLFR